MVFVENPKKDNIFYWQKQREHIPTNNNIILLMIDCALSLLSTEFLTLKLCCSDSSKMSSVACRVLQRSCTFGRSDRGLTTFLECLSNLALNPQPKMLTNMLSTSIKDIYTVNVCNLTINYTSVSNKLWL